MTTRRSSASPLLPPTVLRRRPRWISALAGAMTAALLLAAAPAGAAIPDSTYGPAPDDPVGSETAYTYFRVVEGEATLVFGDTGESQEVVINQPALPGDRLTVAHRARLELVLSDGNLLRAGGGTELIFERLARSPDSDHRQNVLRLLEGELQVVLFDDPDAEPTVIETPDTRVVLQREGTYRLSATYALTRLTVREGVAEMVTPHGSILVREGDEATIGGGDHPRVAFASARPEDALERWGRRLWEEAARAEVAPVDRSLRYSASYLDDHGSWLVIDGRSVWRPRVAPDWRPYWNGRWVYTPSGYLWVSYERWGWVPYHYGTWALDPGYGWVWYPGHRFAPAWVYWYWGPSHVAWVPIGYYSHHYARHYGFSAHFSLRFGLYGFAGGHHRHFRHWLFCDYGHFRRHDLHHHVHPGHDFHRRTRRDVVPRGVVTTDTRGLDRHQRLEPRRVAEELPRRLATRRGGELPDVTPFVAREPRLNRDLERRLVTREPGARLAGTPLAPGTSRPGTRRSDTVSPTPRRLSPDSPSSGGELRRRSAGTPRQGVREGAPDRGAEERRTTLQPRRVRPEAVPRGEARNDSRSDARSGTGTETRRRLDARRPRDPARNSAGERPGTVRPVRPDSVRPDSVRPGSVRPNSVRPRPSRPSESERPTLRPRTVTPRDGTPRQRTPRDTTSRDTTSRDTTRRSTPSPRTGVETRRIGPRRTDPGDRARGSSRPETVRPRTVRPSPPDRPSPSQRPSVRSPRRSAPPSARRPATDRPSTRRPSAPRPSTRRPSTVQPRPRTVRPAPSRPSTSRPSPRTPTTRRPSTSRSSPRPSATRRPSTSRRPSSDRPSVRPRSTPRSTSGARRSAPSRGSSRSGLTRSGSRGRSGSGVRSSPRSGSSRGSSAGRSRGSSSRSGSSAGRSRSGSRRGGGGSARSSRSRGRASRGGGG